MSTNTVSKNNIKFVNINNSVHTLKVHEFGCSNAVVVNPGPDLGCLLYYTLDLYHQTHCRTGLNQKASMLVNPL